MTDEPVGGDPACWLDRVCDDCGRFIEDPVAHRCPPTAADDLDVSRRASRSLEA